MLSDGPMADDDVDGTDLTAGLGPGSEALARVWGMRQRLDPGLYLVPTPIGNLQDITIRALAVLRSATLVLAEDTRVTGQLLAAYGIRVPQLSSYHAHNERARTSQIVDRMVGSGELIALVSDAGTPGISDPGEVLVQAAVEAGVRVVPVPGPCAFVSAAVASGLPTQSLRYCGFLPAKRGARQTALAALASEPATMLFYAPPHALCAVLEDMVKVLGAGRRVCVARELSKLHEEFYRSDLAGALEEFSQREPRGEIVVCVQGADMRARHHAALVQQLSQPHGTGSDAPPEHAGAVTGVSTSAVLPSLSDEEALEQLLLKLLATGMTTKGAAKEAARLLPGLGRKQAYAAALHLTKQQGR